MQDKIYQQLVTAEDVNQTWMITFLKMMCQEAHVAHHHETYPNGMERFEECNVRTCALYRRIEQVDEGTEFATEAVKCPQGHTEHISILVDGVGGKQGLTWHCDDCHSNFVFKPEAKPFGGMSNSTFMRTLARYVKEQSTKPDRSPFEVLHLIIAASIIDPDVSIAEVIPVELKITEESN